MLTDAELQTLRNMGNEQERRMEIVFDTTPDETGKGRVIVDGRFYGLPVAAVSELLATKDALWKACGDDAEMVTEYIESQRVSNVEGKGLATTDSNKGDEA